MSNFINTLLTCVDNKSHQLEILYFLYCVKNNLSYGKLLVIKGSPLNKDEPKYAYTLQGKHRREMDYDNLYDELKRQCEKKICVLQNLFLANKTIGKPDGLVYVNFYEGTPLRDIEYWATVNNTMMFAEIDQEINLKKCIMIPITKSNLHLDYSGEDLMTISIKEEHTLNFFDFLCSYNVTQTDVQSSNIFRSNVTVATQFDSDMNLENALEKALSEKSELVTLCNILTQENSELHLSDTKHTELEKLVQKLTEKNVLLETQLKTAENDKFGLASRIGELLNENTKLKIELSDLSKRCVNLEEQLVKPVVPRTPSVKPVSTQISNSTKLVNKSVTGTSRQISQREKTPISSGIKKPVDLPNSKKPITSSKSNTTQIPRAKKSTF